MVMSSSPDRELLTQAAARQLLERAGEIDADTTSVDALRAAAREAGISEAAFEAALVEMRGRMATPPAPQLPKRRMAVVTGIATAVLLMALGAFVLIPRAVGSGRPEMQTYSFRVNCVPMNQAQDIARSLLAGPDNEIQLQAGSRYLRVRATPAQFQGLQSALSAAAKGLTSCDNTPGR